MFLIESNWSILISFSDPEPQTTKRKQELQLRLFLLVTHHSEFHWIISVLPLSDNEYMWIMLIREEKNIDLSYIVESLFALSAECLSEHTGAVKNNDCLSLTLYWFISTAAWGHQLCVPGAGVQGHWRGDAASCFWRLQRVHICIRPDGSRQKLHHDGTTGEGPARNHPPGKETLLLKAPKYFYWETTQSVYLWRICVDVSVTARI